jgi:3-hydroxy-9,10-secoandrosta-1,3,5(10)-triene-9,17-dione monooxygenase
MDYVLDRPSVTPEERDLRADLVERASKLVPLLASNAQRTEDDRRVAEENITAIEEAGLFSIMQPRRFGGLQVDFRTKLEVTRELARGCGSTAWTTSLMNVCAWFTGLWGEQAQKDVWAEHPANRVAGVFAPTGTAEVVEGGYRVSGVSPLV